MLWLWAAVRVRRGAHFQPRRLREYEDIPRLVASAVELGQGIHVSLGTGNVNTATVTESWAGLTMLEAIAQRTARCDVPLIVTVADAVLVPAARSAIRRSYQKEYKESEGAQVRFIAGPTPTAYAAGVMDILEHENIAVNIMLGAFGAEYLLIGETGARRRITQVVGANRATVLAAAHVSANELLMGEEMYVGGYYTGTRDYHLSSVLAQDWARWVVIGGVLLGVVVVSLGVGI